MPNKFCSRETKDTPSGLAGPPPTASTKWLPRPPSRGAGETGQGWRRPTIS